MAEIQLQPISRMDTLRIYQQYGFHLAELRVYTIAAPRKKNRGSHQQVATAPSSVMRSTWSWLYEK